MGKFNMINSRHVNNIENKLLWVASYLGSLIILLFLGYGMRSVFIVHFIFVLLFSAYFFGIQFIQILFAPILIVFTPINLLLINRFLKKFNLNKPAHTVVVLAHSNLKLLDAWIIPNFSFGEIKILTKYLEKKDAKFSFYTQATQNDVHDIMTDNAIKEVIFYGHGTSHVFQLCNDDILYYCEFGNGKYIKDFVHQLHCGTEHGKSLIDYVVPEENKNQCFLIRKPITGATIEKELKKKIKNL